MDLPYAKHMRVLEDWERNDEEASRGPDAGCIWSVSKHEAIAHLQAL